HQQPIWYGPLQTSSTRKDLPTAKAARRSVERVTKGFRGSSSRSSWPRSVFMRAAIAVFVSPLSFIASRIWSAMISLRVRHRLRRPQGVETDGRLKSGRHRGRYLISAKELG